MSNQEVQDINFEQEWEFQIVRSPDWFENSNCMLCLINPIYETYIHKEHIVQICHRCDNHEIKLRKWMLDLIVRRHYGSKIKKPTILRKLHRKLMCTICFEPINEETDNITMNIKSTNHDVEIRKGGYKAEPFHYMNFQIWLCLLCSHADQIRDEIFLLEVIIGNYNINLNTMFKKSDFISIDDVVTKYEELKHLRETPKVVKD